VILAVKLHADEETGASSDTIEDYVEANLRADKHQRIEVYKLEVRSR
jgi:hypothetical protein